MRSGIQLERSWGWLLVLALTWSGPGCAQLRKSPPPVAEVEVEAQPAGAKAELKPAETKNGTPNGNGRLVLDPEQIRALQSQVIAEQTAAENNGLLRRKCRFTCWLDQFHETWYRRMDNAVRRVDTKWLGEDVIYDPALSTFNLRTLARVGGRRSEGEADFKVRVRADVALPGLEKKLHLYVDNADQDSLPGADPLKQENDMRLGLRAMWKTLTDSEIDAGGGLRWRSSNPVVYADLEWRWKREMSGGVLRLNPRGLYYSDEGFGQKITLSWTKPVGARELFQIRTAELSSEGQVGVAFEQSFRYAWLRSARGRGWVAQASVFPHLQSSDWTWKDSLLNITWRDAFYRKWIYYTITPQVQFPKEDEYKVRPSLRIGLEFLFGGQIGELM